MWRWMHTASGSRKAGRGWVGGRAAQKQSSALKLGRERWVHTSWSQNPWNTNKQEECQQKSDTQKYFVLFGLFMSKVLLQIQSTRGPRSSHCLTTGWPGPDWTDYTQRKSNISHHVDTRTEFQQPPFPVGVEEGVCEVVPIILWDLKGLILDAVVQVLQRRWDEDEDMPE